MNIIVCVKQVPESNKVEVDPISGVLKRGGVSGKLNPYDLFALETAFSLAENNGGIVRTISMGPPQAKDALLETVYMGAAQGVLLSDRKFGGSDVSATSTALSLGIREMGKYDLIICGKQTTDGDTAQVGPELAERLGIEHVCNVQKVLAIDEKQITVLMDLDLEQMTLEVSLPCLITMDKDVNTPRLPSYKRKRTINIDALIRILTADELPGADENKLGLKGSPTQVERIFSPERSIKRSMLEGGSAELSDALYGILKERKFI